MVRAETTGLDDVDYA